MTGGEPIRAISLGQVYEDALGQWVVLDEESSSEHVTLVPFPYGHRRPAFREEVERMSPSGDLEMADASRDALVTFVSAFRRAVETEYRDGGEPPEWLRNGYDDARELAGRDRETWPAPWEKGGAE